MKFARMFTTLLTAVVCSACMAPPSPTNPSLSGSMFEQGKKYLVENNYQMAEASFRVALEAYESPEVLDGLGCIFMEQGKFVLAEEFFYLAIGLDPSYSTAHGNLAALYEHLGLQQQAEQHYRRSLELGPENYRIRNNFAAFLLDNNANRSTVEDVLREALVTAGKEAVIKDNLDYMQESKKW
jgi:Flp pilus assembly protein TadD